MIKIQYLGQPRTYPAEVLGLGERKVMRTNETIEVRDEIASELLKNENWKEIKNEKEKKEGSEK
jgi:hypothetical protein